MRVPLRLTHVRNDGHTPGRRDIPEVDVQGTRDFDVASMPQL
jgi:hypothetical protein